MSKKSKIMGIDLGSTNTFVAKVNIKLDGSYYPTVIQSGEGPRNVPSMVTIKPQTD